MRIDLGDLPAGPGSLREKLLDLLQMRGITDSEITITGLPAPKQEKPRGLFGHIRILPDKS